MIVIHREIYKSLFCFKHRYLFFLDLDYVSLMQLILIFECALVEFTNLNCILKPDFEFRYSELRKLILNVDIKDVWYMEILFITDFLSYSNQFYYFQL